MKSNRLGNAGEEKSNINDIFQWTPTHGHTCVGWQAKTYIHVCADIGCCLQDLTSMMASRNGWQLS